MVQGRETRNSLSWQPYMLCDMLARLSCICSVVSKLWSCIRMLWMQVNYACIKHWMIVFGHHMPCFKPKKTCFAWLCTHIDACLTWTWLWNAFGWCMKLYYSVKIYYALFNVGFNEICLFLIPECMWLNSSD